MAKAAAGKPPVAPATTRSAALPTRDAVSSARYALDIPELIDSVVVFADALGTSASTEAPAEAQSFLAALRGTEDRLLRRLRHAKRKAPTANYRWFSDCLILTVQANDVQAVITLLEVTAQAQVDFLLNGVFLRGAVARGPHYHSPNIDYGPALVKATHLERNAATYPRILLADEVWATIGPARKHLRGLVMVDDADGHRFLNYLTLLAADARARARGQITAALQAAKSETVEKYEWLEEYYTAVSRSSQSDASVRFRTEDP